MTNGSSKTDAGSKADVLLRVADVAKAFGPTKAIRTASMELRRGEVQCIVGENGSGKSTLVKILSGVHRPDSGHLELEGESVENLPTPGDALDAGISTVFQEVLVVEPRSVLENVWLGVDGTIKTAVGDEDRRPRAAAILEELLGYTLPLDAPVEALSLSDRQACSIARALVRDPKVLILDEATSALDVQTRDRLFAIVRRLAKDGTATIFISHRMDEIAEIGDCVTVMRNGDTVATLGKKEATADELVRLMTGGEHLAQSEAREATARAKVGDVVLRTDNLCLTPGGAPVDLELRAGELVGLAGLEGQGQDAFIKALWGLGTPGTVFAGDTAITSPRQAAGLGIGYVPRERRAESIFESKSIRENFAAATFDKDVGKANLLSIGNSRKRLQEWIARLSIVMGSDENLITTLSGGNQQKVVIARWLATEPRVLLLNDPTRGIDIGAKRDLYKLLGELAQEGVAVVMLSTEVDEQIELMDRVLVFREQQCFTELSRKQVNRQSLVSAYFGQATTRVGSRKKAANA